MTFEKLAYAQRVLRAAHESLQKQAGLDQVIGGGAKLVGRVASKPLRMAGNAYWGAAGHAADSMFTQGSNAHKLLKPVAQTGIAAMGGVGLYEGGKSAINTAKASRIGFDPNVQGYARQRLNPQYGYQEVFV